MEKTERKIIPKRERNKQLNIRLTGEEIKLMQKNIEKSKLKQSEYIRKSILEKTL